MGSVGGVPRADLAVFPVAVRAWIRAALQVVSRGAVRLVVPQVVFPAGSPVLQAGCECS